MDKKLAFIIKLILAALIAMGICRYAYPQYRQAQVNFLSKLSRDYIWFLDFSNVKRLDPQTVRNYARYCQAVDVVMPHRHDVQSMLGFCYFYMGQPSQSIVYYRKAIALDPDYFWDYFNLASILYEQGNVQQAAGLLKSAIGCDGSHALQEIFSSKINIDLLKNRISPMDVAARLKQGYIQANELLAIISMNIKIPAGWQPVLFF